MRSPEWKRWPVGLALCGLGAANACGNSSGGPVEGSPDATAEGATQEEAGQDAAVGEAGAEGSASPPVDATVPGPAPEADASDAAPDGGPGDANAHDAGDGGDGGIVGPTLVESGTNLSILGITKDNYVVYKDYSSNTYYAKSAYGGSPIVIYAVPAASTYTYQALSGDDVFVFDVGSNYISTVTMWSSRLAQPVTLTTSGLATYFFSAWATDDAMHVAYLQSSGDGTVSSLYGANDDGSSPTLLVGGIVTASNAGRCFPLLEFRGGYAFASYCRSTDAGITRAIEAFSLDAGWAPVSTIPNVVFTGTVEGTPAVPFYFPFVVDPDAGRVIAASAGALEVFPIDGGQATPLDPNTPWIASQFLAASNTNPWYAVYNTDAGVLMQAYADTPVPRVLVDGGIAKFVAGSLDGKWMMVSSGSNAQGFIDLSTVSTVNPGTAQVIATRVDYGNLIVNAQNGAFTTDGQYSIVYTNQTQSSGGTSLFAVRSMGVAPPFLARQLSNGHAVWSYPLAGSKVLLVDNFVDTDGGAGSVATIDLDLVDPSSGAVGISLVKGVANNTAVSADHSLVAFLGNGPSPGIYVTPVP